MIKFFLNPFNLLWLFVLLGIILLYLNKKRASKFIFILSGIWFLVISTPLIPNLVLNSLENYSKPIKVDQLELSPDDQIHIVVLGGGHGFDDRLPPNSLLSLNALGRLNEGIRLHRQLSNSILVLSGYSASGRTTQAEMLYKTARLLGVNEDSIIMQMDPGNTFEEAKEYSENFKGNYKVILVTSAAHMPRAVMMFERFGVEVTPSPTNFRLIGLDRSTLFSLPSIKNINNLHTGIYEYAGMLRYSF